MPSKHVSHLCEVCQAVHWPTQSELNRGKSRTCRAAACVQEYRRRHAPVGARVYAGPPRGAASPNYRKTERHVAHLKAHKQHTLAQTAAQQAKKRLQVAGVSWWTQTKPDEHGQAAKREQARMSAQARDSREPREL